MSQKIKYLYDNKQISEILAEGFAKVCQQKPQFPINYLARYLKNHTTDSKQKSDLLDRVEANVKTSQILVQKQEHLQRQAQISLQKASTEQANTQQFLSKIASTERHQQILNQFCQFLNSKLNLGAVYIGELEHQTKKVNLLQEDSEDAHLELEKQKVVKFKYASQQQRDVIVGKILPLDSVVGRLLTQADQPPAEQNVQGQQAITLEQRGEVYLSTVVGNQELRFFRFPKLGAWLASSVSIKSYLKQNLFDQNTAKVQSYKKVLHQFEKQLQEKQAKFKQVYDQKVNAGGEQKQLEEMEREFQRQKSELSTPALQPFSFYQRKFVICVDTLGLDIEITSQQKQQLRSYFSHLKCSWEDQEQRQLSHDIDAQLAIITQHDEGDVTNFVQQLTGVIDEEEKEVIAHQEVEKVKDNEKLFQLQSNTVRLDRTKEYLAEEKFLKYWNHLLSLNVIKYPQVIKQFFILLGYKKDDFCLKNSNVLDWLQARQLLKTQASKVLQRLNAINPRGSKPQLIPSYALCHRIAKNIEGLQVNQLASYNLYLAWILRLLQLYVKTRGQDRDARVVKINAEREVRQQRIKETDDKASEKKEKLEALRAELQQKGQLQAFDEEAWKNQWEEENPLGEIPEAVQDDIDRDLEDVQEQGKEQRQYD